MDAAFMNEANLDPLIDLGAPLVGRLATNPRLEALAAPHLARPVGRPPSEGDEFVVELGQHKAESWRHSVRLLLVVVDKPDPKSGQLELFPRHFFLGTTWSDAERSGVELLEHYRARGTFEDRIGEFNARSRRTSPAGALRRTKRLSFWGSWPTVLSRSCAASWRAGRLRLSAGTSAGRRRPCCAPAGASSPAAGGSSSMSPWRSCRCGRESSSAWPPGCAPAERRGLEGPALAAGSRRLVTPTLASSSASQSWLTLANADHPPPNAVGVRGRCQPRHPDSLTITSSVTHPASDGGRRAKA
jgi:hypothetical protein